MTKKVMRQVLKKIEIAHDFLLDEEYYQSRKMLRETFLILEEALETEDEPVYWEMPDGKIVDKWGLQFYRGDTGTPLYTTPQPKLETKDEQWGSSSITNPEFVAEQKEKTQQLRNMVDAQNMASKSTYKEQVETKDAPVAWRYNGNLHEFDPSDWATEKVIPLYERPQRTWVGLTDEEIESVYMDTLNFKQNAKALETKLKEKNT